MAYRVANQFRLVLQSESLHQSGAMVLHRPLADIEPPGNIRIRVPLRRKLQHLTLSGSQGFMWIERARLGSLNIVVNGNLRHRWTEEASGRRQ